MSMSVYDADFFNWNFEMARHQLQNARICHIPLCFFFDGNFKMIAGFFFPTFFFRSGGDFDINVRQFIYGTTSFRKTGINR